MVPMIASTTSATIDSNLPGEKIAMGIADSATSHIMDVLSKNLYSDPERAVLREYSTNALDAHIEVGETRPIEVTLPTSLSPFFKVRDYGVGLSVEDIRTIYSQYGESTKRSTNKQTGMLGLGCKSAFSYTSQFTVTSVKAGQRITVVISRDDDGTGAMTVADTSLTDEPNGTEVVVPTKRHNNFSRLAQTFFSFWTPGTVLVDGVAPKRVDGLWLNDRLCVIDGYDSYIVMGNVAYPATLSVDLPYATALVAFVPIGSVEFTPSREALMYTAKTKAHLEQVVADFSASIVGSLQRAIDLADTPQDAIKAFNNWSRSLPKEARAAKYTFKGKDLPTSYTNDSTVLVRRNSNRMNESQRAKEVQVAVWPDAVWITGYDAGSFTVGQKKKLLKWCENFNGSVQYFILTDKPIPRQWIDADRIVAWSVIKDIKLPRAAGSSIGRTAGTFDIIRDGEVEYEVSADEFDADAPMFYHVGQPHEVRSQAKLIADTTDSFTIVCMFTNRTAKFLRTFPNAKPVSAAVKAAHSLWVKKLTGNDKKALYLKTQMSYLTDQVRRLDLDKIEDPAFRYIDKLTRRDVDGHAKTMRTFQNMGLRTKLIEIEDPMDRYPLLTYSAIMRDPEHSLQYINVFYNMNKESK